MMRLKTIPAEAETNMHLSLNKGHFVRRAVLAVGRLEENGDSGFRLVAIAAGMRKGLAVNRMPHATQAEAFGEYRYNGTVMCRRRA